ncbi:MAG TPA: PHP domain-containing protein, partial [Thermoanaerobaculia bacterium]|nr:PHP domain-containing protein [Thermoanaerobaculia bacterium]
MARKTAPPYAELHAASAFSFLDGASLPEDLADRAAALELPAVALVDANGVYAAPRFHQAAKQAGVKALVGAEVTLADEPSLFQQRARFGPIGLVPEPKPGAGPRGVDTQARLTLLAAS